MKTDLSYQHKSKEELISELLELHTNYELLNDSYNKKIQESKLQEVALAKLKQYTVELSNLPPSANLEVYISKMIKDITGAKGAVFSDYNAGTRTLTVQHIELEQGLLQKVIGLLGKQIKNIHIYLSEEMYQQITTEICGYRETLYDSSFGSIPRPIAAAVQKLVKVNRFIGIAYMIEGQMYGTSLLGMSKDQPDPPKDIVENFIYLAAVSLRRKKAEDAIKDSEERFRTLYEGAPDAIFLIDPVSGKILDANKAASVLLLKKHEDILRMYQYELHPHQPSNYTKSFLERHVVESQFSGFNRPIENTVLRADGVFVPVEITAQMIVFRGQKVLMGSFRNITERKQAESVMQQVLTELQTLIENVQQGVLLENEHRNIQFSNKKFCELFEIGSPAEIHGINGNDLVQRMQHHFADPEGFVHSIQKRLNGQSITLSEEFTLADGRIFERDYIPVNINGKKYRNYWIYRDISERKQAEKALRDSQTHISALLQAIPDIILLHNKEGVYVAYHAPQISKLYAPPEELMGKSIDEVLPVDVAQGFRRIFNETLKTNQVQTYEYSLDLPQGTTYFETRTIAYEGEKILSFIRDITERKQAELKIQEQNKELKKLNEDKDRFMSILAHDLKNPFNSILGFLDLLSHNIHKYDITKIEKLISVVKTSSEQFYQLLESLLVWARSQSGKMTYMPEELDFFQTTKTVIDELRLNAVAKNIQINLLEKDVKKVFADMEMVKTILRNLISNAIKFTNPGGKIDIFCENNTEFVTIVVSDNGIGISDEKLGSLFELSAHYSTKGTSGEHGSGLGLFLCKELVEKQGGRIWVESEQGKGCDFKFTLPEIPESDK